MSGKRPVSDPEITGAIESVLDDLERMKVLMQGSIIALDDMRCRVLVRHENTPPGPWDDEYAEN